VIMMSREITEIPEKETVLNQIAIKEKETTTKCQFVAAIETFSDKMKDGSFLDLDAHRTIKQSNLAKFKTFLLKLI